MPTGLFVPSPLAERSEPRVDDAQDLHDVLAAVSLRHGGREIKLVIGLDIGRVIRVVELPAELSPRARAQLTAHEKTRPWRQIAAVELYVFDVQAVEKQPDTPGADDPLFLYGVLRGPYPQALRDGVSGVEGQLASTRGELLDGLVFGIQSAFHYERGRSGSSCVHAALPIDPGASSTVLAFPLAAMGDDGTNELVAAQMIADVIGTMRADLGDDLATDPVPVPNRAQYERDLTSGGWTIKGDTALHLGGKGWFASLFAPNKRQQLPREIALADYVPLIHTNLARLPGWPDPARAQLHGRIGISPGVMPLARTSTNHGIQPPRTKTNPGLIPPPPVFAQRPRPLPPPPPPPFTPRNRAPTPAPPFRPRTQHRSQPRTVMPGLTAPKPKEWIRRLIDDHTPRDRRRSRLVTPGLATGVTVPDWMFDLIEVEFPDDDK